jgi:4-hydroxy-L-threonine phosphate dehydrogenase PdxA
MALPRLAIALGDPGGIGPEIALKAAIDPDVRALCRPLLFGDPAVLEAHAAACGLRTKLRVVARVQDARALGEGVSGEGVTLVAREQFRGEELRVGEISAAHGRSTIDSARAAIEAAVRGEVDAVVAAPHTESAIKLAGVEFDGYPSFVARCTGTPPEDAYLMLCFEHAGAEMRIAHTTLHVSLRRALELVTFERVQNVLRATDSALRRIGVLAPRLAVAGLNPHASEGGLFGDEEARLIAPAIENAKAAGLTVEGPFGADIMLHKSGYDAFIVMYHDQGHVAAKAMAPNGVAALTIGTPVLFSSVAHGSALDIAGKNRADPGAMIQAIRRLTAVFPSRPRYTGSECASIR